MPQIIIPLAVTVGAATIISKVTKSSTEKQIKAQQQASAQSVATEEKIAKQQSEAEQNRLAQEAAATEKQLALSEKEMILSNQRTQIDTLTNIIATNRSIQGAQGAQIVSAPQPVKSYSVFDKINMFLHNIFRG